jgi:hypothetical protein
MRPDGDLHHLIRTMPAKGAHLAGSRLRMNSYGDSPRDDRRWGTRGTVVGYWPSAGGEKAMEKAMDIEHESDWRVVVHLSEDRKRTIAHATLGDGGPELTGHGEAHRSPYDSDVPRIGDELAAGRALMDLGQKLLRVTEDDIGTLEGRPVHLNQ